MIEELQTASGLLSAALERYLAACSVIGSGYVPSSPLKHISRAISDLIPREIELIDSYEAKLKQVKSIVYRTRNIIPTISPINILPPDILIHIFSLVKDAQPCYFKDSDTGVAFPLKYPEVLSHVCSHWRQIAIHSRALWSHIDLVSSQGHHLSKNIFDRAEVFVARADRTPLDVHIIGQTSDNTPDTDIGLTRFCESVATRTRSLQLSAYHVFNNLHVSILQSIFANCTPGTLDQLVLSGNGHRRAYNLIEASTPLVPNSHVLDISHRRLEDCLLPIRVLRLTGVYFHWTSQAYHGLVELRLLPQRLKPFVTESQLTGILNGSPKLRVLHLGLEIIALLPRTVPRVPANLDDLEELNLCQMGCEQYGCMLQLISPGAKPLQLSMYFPCARFPLLFGDETTKFFARSNITDLSIQSSDNRSLPLLELFRLLHIPGLRTLSLTNFYMDERHTFNTYDYEAPSTSGENIQSLAISELSVLNFIRCLVDLDHLEKVVEILPIRILGIADCLVCSEEGGYFKAQECEERIAKSVSALKFISVLQCP